MDSLFEEPAPRPAHVSNRGRLTGIAALAASGELVEAPRDVECFELPCRSLLNKCSSPRMPFDFTINPYRGCELGCAYCYARYTHEYLELSPGHDFERRIYAKRGAARVLARELVRHDPAKGIAIGTATDPYQPLERRMGLTRAILEELARHRGLRVHVTTKSDLVLRDLDVLKEIAARSVFDVNLTVTTVDAGLARSLEPRAPTPEKRLRAIRALREAGIEARLLLCPLLPWITDSRLQIRSVLRAAREAGALAAYTQVLFLPEATRPTFFAWLEGFRPGLVPRYRRLYEHGNYVTQGFSQPILERFAEERRACGFTDEDERSPTPARSPGDGVRPLAQLPLFA
jgi:DNA repair photolyase